LAYTITTPSPSHLRIICIHHHNTITITPTAFRIILMPVDTFKTMLQVEGKQAMPKLMAKFKVRVALFLFFYSM
jgi:hypothetical protein